MSAIYPDIFSAARAFDIAAVEAMVAAGADINAFGPDGQTAFSAVLNQLYSHDEWDERDVGERTENHVPFEDREVDVVPMLKRMLKLGADINAAKEVDGDSENALLHAIYTQDEYMLRFLLRNGADPNFRYASNNEQEACRPYIMDHIITEQSIFPLMSGKLRDRKRLSDIEKLLVEHGARYETEEYERKISAPEYKAELAQRGKLDPEFHYTLTGAGNAECTVQVNGSRARFLPSYIGEGIEDVLQALYKIVLSEKYDENDNVAYWPADGCTVCFDEEGRFTTLHLLDEGGELRVRVWYDDEDKAGNYLIDERCSMGALTYQVVKAYDLMLKKHGLLGFSKDWMTLLCPDLRIFILLKAYALRITDYTWHSVDNSGAFSDYQDELAILGMMM